jgi:hypothetical protein
MTGVIIVFRSIATTCIGLALVACGGGSNEGGPTTAPPTSTAESETSSTSRLLSGTFSFDGRQTKTVFFEDKDGWAYWQGDIILGRTSDIGALEDRKRASQASALGGYRTDAGRWPNGVLVYEAGALPTATRELLRIGMKHVASQSSVRFSRDLTYAASRVFRDSTIYDLVQISPTNDASFGGSSMVGRVGGTQPLILSTGLVGLDGASVVAHELLHALGAWHEQSREDRDSFVQVFSNNVLPQFAYNFDTHISDGALHGSYDYCSVMHYGRFAFTTGSGPTIVPNSGFQCNVFLADGSGMATVTDIGQRLGLSVGDAAMVNFLYADAPSLRPIADAGNDVDVRALALNVQLDGRASLAFGGATIVRYQWTPAVGRFCPGPRDCTPNPIQNNTSAVASVSQVRGRFDSLSVGQYRLTVTDSMGRVMSDVVTVKLRN